MARLVLALLALTAVNADATQSASLVTTAKAAALTAHGHFTSGSFAASEAYYLRAYELFTQNKGAGHFLTKAMLLRVDRLRNLNGNKGPATDADATGVSTPLDISTLSSGYTQQAASQTPRRRNYTTTRFDASGNGVDTGRIEVKVNGVWGTVCDDGFTNSGAMVACKAMGFADGGVMHPAWSSATTGHQGWNTPFSTSPINLDDAACTGSETSLFDCPSAILNDGSNGGSGQINCQHKEDIAVCCGSAYVTGGATCARPESTIRFDASGNGVDTGRIEVKVNGVWGTVCDDGFTNSGAMVACRAMGFADGGVVATHATWGTPYATSPINMDNAACTGSESSLDECPGAIIVGSEGFGGCTHSEDIAVCCGSAYVTGGATCAR